MSSRAITDVLSVSLESKSMRYPTDFITYGSLPTFAPTFIRTLGPWAIYCDAALNEGGATYIARQG